jgi:hypothetical protein
MSLTWGLLIYNETAFVWVGACEGAFPGMAFVHSVVLLLAIGRATGFSSSAASNAAAVYAATYGSAESVDQAAYNSADFWKEVAAEIPGFNDAPELQRYRGFVSNLISKPPGEVLTLGTGQEVLTQYMFPGLQDDDVMREPFPALPEVEQALVELAPSAQEELASLLAERPIMDDDAPAEPEGIGDGTQPWNRAAWYGWQFMSLRDAKLWMPSTIKALESTVPLAHRFIGIARQRANCRGTLHSDRRNYLLSSLVGLRVPEGECGVIVPGSGILVPDQGRLLRDGEVVVLDNTFKHFVYNDDKLDDRFVLMCEIWHPALTPVERKAIATTMAVKDRYTLTALRQCPWGYSDDELSRAIENKDFENLEFWRTISFGMPAA